MGQELRVRVLGTTELAVDGRPLAGLASAKATALLVYLAMTGRPQSRSALAGLLWSDLPEATARANLRLALTKLAMRCVKWRLGPVSGHRGVAAQRVRAEPTTGQARTA